MANPADQTVNILEQLKSQVEQMLLLLNQKEKHVIEERFDLHNKGRKTLEDIGSFYNVTRERIRQIEKTALGKLRRNIENFAAYGLNDIAYQYLNSNGGIAKAGFLISFLLTNGEEQSRSSILLILSLDKRFEYFSNTIHYYPFFKLNSVGNDCVNKISEFSIEELKRKNELINHKDLWSAIKQQNLVVENMDITSLQAILQINKSFKVVEEKVGLIEWRQINPRTLRDKIFFILRKNNKPMHFVDIANMIIEESFDKKNVNMQAVHNELIRHQDFVLIGRGIYALKEWGYEHGTVAEIIMQILKDKESLSESEIIEEVLKRRKVKPITILLNLKNKKQFIRVGRKQYAVKKS